MRLNVAFVALALFTPVGLDAQQPPPRDPPVSARALLPDAPTDEAELRRKLEAEPSNPAHHVALAIALERRGAYDEAEATWMGARKATPVTSTLLKQIAGFYNRTGNFEKTIATMEEAAALTPNDASGYHLVATFYQEKVNKDQRLPESQRWTYILQGIAAEDRALAVKPDYMEAMVYKNILLREQSRLESDPAQQKMLLAEADRLRARAMELQKGGQARMNQGVMARPEGPMPPPPPPPPQPPCAARETADGQAPVRVGGNIKAPTKTLDVRPEYPAAAQQARVQGVVILEALVSTTGDVVAPCVLRSIPLLDQAAIDAVSQWKFEVTLLNGVPVPVIMTVTVNFTLQD
jgi:TonB family protein